MPINTQAAQQAQGQQIAQTYAGLKNNLQGGVGATQGIFDRAAQGVGNAYGSGMSDLQAITDRYQGATGSHNTALGIGTSAPTNALEGGLASMLANMVTRRTGAQAALGQQGAAYAGVAQKAVGDAEQQGALAQTDSANKLNKAMYAMMGQEETAKGQVELQKLSNQAKLAQEQANTQNIRSQGDAQVRAAQVAAESRKNMLDYEAQLKQNDPMYQLNLASKSKQLDDLLNKTGGSGQIAVDQFMKDNGIDPNSDEATLFKTITGDAAQAAGSPSSTNHDAYSLAEAGMPGAIQTLLDTRDPKKAGEAGDWPEYFKRTYANLKNPSQLEAPDQDTLNTLLQLYYGKTKSR